MESFLSDITNLRLAPIEICEQQMSGERSVDGVFLLSDTRECSHLRVKRGDVASRIVYLHTSESDELNIEVESGAKLYLVEVLSGGVRSSVKLKQGSDSEIAITTIQLGDSELNYCIDLDGEGCSAQVDSLQLTTSSQVATNNLRMAHNSAHCTSQSCSKAIAGGSSTSSFTGLVYVASGSQCTEAYQNSRNILLSPTAKIVAEPQLEIYADDVKCSHGATIGEMNRDAILYMRQRGLSEEQARKVQLEGFASQLAQECAVEEVREALTKLISDYLNDM